MLANAAPLASLDTAPAAGTVSFVRLLLVEDDPRLLRSVSEALREAGYAVDTAPDGMEALYKIENTSYDAVVLDVMLPGMDGWEILRRMRKTQRTPVLMLTARDRTADRVRGLDAGADDYLIKPFELDELYARLRALIRRSAGVTESLVVLEDLTVDLGAKAATRDGQPVPLTAREYAILEYLALHRGKVISRSVLFDHIFDEHADPNSNLLDVHVSGIRRKVGRDVILTRRGQGFYIEG